MRLTLTPTNTHYNNFYTKDQKTNAYNVLTEKDSQISNFLKASQGPEDCHIRASALTTYIYCTYKCIVDGFIMKLTDPSEHVQKYLQQLHDKSYIQKELTALFNKSEKKESDEHYNKLNTYINYLERENTPLFHTSSNLNVEITQLPLESTATNSISNYIQPITQDQASKIVRGNLDKGCFTCVIYRNGGTINVALIDVKNLNAVIHHSLPPLKDNEDISTENLINALNKTIDPKEKIVNELCLYSTEQNNVNNKELSTEFFTQLTKDHRLVFKDLSRDYAPLELNKQLKFGKTWLVRKSSISNMLVVHFVKYNEKDKCFSIYPQPVAFFKNESGVEMWHYVTDEDLKDSKKFLNIAIEKINQADLEQILILINKEEGTKLNLANIHVPKK